MGRVWGAQERLLMRPMCSGVYSAHIDGLVGPKTLQWRTQFLNKNHFSKVLNSSSGPSFRAKNAGLTDPSTDQIMCPVRRTLTFLSFLKESCLLSNVYLCSMVYVTDDLNHNLDHIIMV